MSVSNEQECSEVVYGDSQNEEQDDVHEEVGVLFKVTFIYRNVLIRFMGHAFWYSKKEGGERHLASKYCNLTGYTNMYNCFSITP